MLVCDLEYILNSLHVIFHQLLLVKVSEQLRQTAISGYFSHTVSSKLTAKNNEIKLFNFYELLPLSLTSDFESENDVG